MKSTLNIYSIETGKLVTVLTTKSKDLKKAVYSHIEINYNIFKISATETYFIHA